MRLHVGEYRRLHIKTAGVGPGGVSFSATNNASAFLFSGLDVIQDALQLYLADLRAHLGGGIERITHSHFPGAAGEIVDELIIDFFVDQEARAGAAHFAFVGVNAPERCLRRAREVGVWENDVGRLATEFQR